MAVCKNCSAIIPDGAELCSSCLEEEKVKSNESYLDSLLNSVQNSAPDIDGIYKKKNGGKADKLENDAEPEEKIQGKKSSSDDYIDYTVDMNEFKDLFEALDVDGNSHSDDSDDLIDMNDMNDMNKDEQLDDLLMKYINDDKYIDNDNMPAEELHADDIYKDEVHTDKLDEDGLHTDSISADDLHINDINADDNQADDLFSDMILADELTGNADFDTVSPADFFEEYAASEQDDIAAEALGSGLDNSEEELEEDDILSLLNAIPLDDPISQDAKAIGNILSGQGELSEAPTVGEVFSDTLKVVTNLDDPDVLVDGIDEHLTGAATEDTKKKKKKKKEDKKAARKRSKDSKDIKDNENKKAEQEKLSAGIADDKQEAKEASRQGKKNILQRLFGNVHDEKAKKQAEKERQRESASSSMKDPAAQGKKKGGLLAKIFKPQDAGTAAGEEDQEPEGGKRAANAEKRRNAKEERREKKEKRKKRKEVIQVIDEIEEDEGRINRVGAGIVFAFFGLVALVLIIGTDSVSYSLSIQHATDYFERQKYNEAYNEISGIEVKDEDRGIYDRIMTVMYVNKQLNSYNNYYYLNMYPQALDSLLKGIERYDKYIEYATMLGIKSDLDYVRGQILAELENVFHISESELKEIIQMEDAEEYSERIYSIVREMNRQAGQE